MDENAGEYVCDTETLPRHFYAWILRNDAWISCIFISCCRKKNCFFFCAERRIKDLCTRHIMVLMFFRTSMPSNQHVCKWTFRKS